MHGDILGGVMSKSIFGISTLNEVVAGMRVTSTAYKAALEEGRIIGRREGMAKLDQAWAQINAQGGVIDRAVPYDVGYDSAIGDALTIIEKLGGMDPQKRGKE